jgi:hypothetical protein
MLNQAVMAAASSGLIATARRRQAPALPKRFYSLSAMPRLKCAGASPGLSAKTRRSGALGLGVAPETQKRGRIVKERSGEIGRQRDRAFPALHGLFEQPPVNARSGAN